jgi:hypothetical protein
LEIRFTNHSLVRCREQDISPKWVKKQLKKMPPFTGKLRWKLEDGHEVIVKREGPNILLITIVGIKKRLKSKLVRDGRNRGEVKTGTAQGDQIIQKMRTVGKR